MATVGSKNQPIVQTTDTFNPVADINTLANWVATNYANFKVLGAGQTAAGLTGADVFTGLVVWEADSGLFFQRSPSASWVPLGIGSVPRGELTKTVAQTITSGSSVTITGWTATSSRNLTVNATAGSITVPYAGRYNIYGQLHFANNGTGARWIAVLQNGTGLSRSAVSAPSSSTLYQGMPIAITGQMLAANDVITLQGLQVSGGNLDVIYGKFVVEYVGA